MTSFFGQIPRIIVVTLAASCALSACGQADSQLADAPIPRAAATADATLTTVPPLNEEYPELFNEQGCAIAEVTPALDDLSTATQADIVEALPPGAQDQIEANGQVDLDSMPAGQLGSLLDAQGTEVSDCNMRGETPTNPWEFYGYVGHDANKVPAGTVRANLVAASDHTWRVRGLAAAPSAGGTVTVTATLVDVAGSTLARVSAVSPVRGVRAGEPVPFELTSEVPAADVADVRYAVTEAPATASRELVITIENVLADGDNSVIFGDVNNASNVAISNPSGVVAVIRGDGHVADIVKFAVNEPGSTRVMQELRPGLSGTFEMVVADPAHTLTTDSVEAWAYGS